MLMVASMAFQKAEPTVDRSVGLKAEPTAGR